MHNKCECLSCKCFVYCLSRVYKFFIWCKVYITDCSKKGKIGWVCSFLAFFCCFLSWSWRSYPYGCSFWSFKKSICCWIIGFFCGGVFLICSLLTFLIFWELNPHISFLYNSFCFFLPSAHLHDCIFNHIIIAFVKWNTLMLCFPERTFLLKSIPQYQ